jgi:hypothetical protein
MGGADRRTRWLAAGAALALACLAVGPGRAGEKSKGARYGVALDLKGYPQGTPKQALASVLKAVDAKRIDYLVAQLADPAFVDDRVKRVYGGEFREQVEDTRANLGPLVVRQLRRALKEGTWKKEEGAAVVLIPPKGAAPARAARFRRVGERWYLESPWAPPRPEKD